MAFTTWRVRRRFQWNGWVYAPLGPCECSLVEGTNLVSTKIDGRGNPVSAPWDTNPCQNRDYCKGFSGTGCSCNDSGYCGFSGSGGACGVKPHTYAGDIWLVQENDPRKEHLLLQRFAIYDATLPPADKLLKDEMYINFTQGEPRGNKVYFSQGERIEVEAGRPVLAK